MLNSLSLYIDLKVTRSAFRSNEKVGSSSQTKKTATPTPGGPMASEKQAEGGGRQRKVDDYLLLSAHTADNKSKKA
uniref:Uncharacterized protein n=1 Tax=Romanomermis culicivorax TaxID=13658 RepID=A0A915KPP2_ROMCU